MKLLFTLLPHKVIKLIYEVYRNLITRHNVEELTGHVIVKLLVVVLATVGVGMSDSEK